MVSSPPRPHFTPRERPGTHFTGGWVGSRAGLDGADNLVPTGIRSRTVQPVAQSLYRLSYRAHISIMNYFRKVITNVLHEIQLGSEVHYIVLTDLSRIIGMTTKQALSHIRRLLWDDFSGNNITCRSLIPN